MRKTRAVLIGTNAYPFLMRYWYEIFTRKWQDEVDKVYIAISNPEHKSAWLNTRKLLQSHPKIEVVETNTNWPDSINAVAKTITEDLVLLAHDDTFIFKPGVLTKYFDMCEEENKVITPITPIFTPKDLVEELMQKKYPEQLPLRVEETGETGYSFYCNMCILPRELMAKTSIDFGEWHVLRGEYCDLLDWTPIVNDFKADTNFLFMLELLKAGAHFHAIPKMEIATIYNFPDPISELLRLKKEKIGPFGDDSGWIHLQTMAYHVYGLYFDVGEREALTIQSGGPVTRKIHNLQGRVGEPAFTWALTMQIAWIKEFMSVGNFGGIQKYYEHANAEIDYIIRFARLDRRKIHQFKRIFHKLIWQ